MLPCGWIRCCNSALPIALYWRLQHLITLMQLKHVSINRVLPCCQFGYLPCPYWRGASAAPVFRGELQIPSQGPAAGSGAGAAAAKSAGGSTAVALASSEGTGMGPLVTKTGSSLGDKLAGQVLGSWTSPSAGFLEDVVVECCERVAHCRQGLSEIRQGAWHRIFHITISPWFLLRDEFNSIVLIVFHPTKK
jgi:hypothetical protein